MMKTMMMSWLMTTGPVATSVPVVREHLSVPPSLLGIWWVPMVLSNMQPKGLAFNRRTDSSEGRWKRQGRSEGPLGNSSPVSLDSFLKTFTSHAAPLFLDGNPVPRVEPRCLHSPLPTPLRQWWPRSPFLFQPSWPRNPSLPIRTSSNRHLPHLVIPLMRRVGWMRLFITLWTCLWST